MSNIQSIDQLLRSLGGSGTTRPRRRIGRSKRRKGTRFLKKWVWDATEIHSKKMETTDIFLGASDVSDYITGQLMFARNN